MPITAKQWNKGKVTIDDPIYGEIRFNSCLPIEWQLYEIRCDFCDKIKDCRKCSAFEYSLLYQLINSIEITYPSDALQAKLARLVEAAQRIVDRSKNYDQELWAGLPDVLEPKAAIEAAK